MTSHSKTLLSTNPQLMPGISLSFCICLNCFPRINAADDVEDVFAGEAVLRLRGDIAAILIVQSMLGDVSCQSVPSDSLALALALALALDLVVVVLILYEVLL